MANDFIDQVKAGKFDLAELQQSFSEAGASLVTITGWEICYSTTTGQLSEYATVTTNDVSNPITGVGIIAYSGNGATMFCLQYDNGFSTNEINVSIGTMLYNPQTYGNQAQCLVYGWTQNGSFFVPQMMTIQSC